MVTRLTGPSTMLQTPCVQNPATDVPGLQICIANDTCEQKSAADVPGVHAPMRGKPGRRSLWVRRRKARKFADGSDDSANSSLDSANDSMDHPVADDSFTELVDVVQF